MINSFSWSTGYLDSYNPMLHTEIVGLHSSQSPQDWWSVINNLQILLVDSPVQDWQNVNHRSCPPPIDKMSILPGLTQKLLLHFDHAFTMLNFFNSMMIRYHSNRINKTPTCRRNVWRALSSMSIPSKLYSFLQHLFLLSSITQYKFLLF